MLLCLALQATSAAAQSSGVSAQTLGVIVNMEDAQSREVAEFYRKRRGIPAANIIKVRFRADTNTLSEQEFRRIKQQVDERTPAAIQAYALTWVRPYRVACMSITTAMAMGFNKEFCNDSCSTTRASAYFDSDSAQPAVDLGIRPSMLLAATTVQQAHALIERGIAADRSAPRGTAYLVNSGDAARSVRVPRYALVNAVLGDVINIKRIDNGAVRDAKDVMFYFTGALRVSDLQTNLFLPGAVADHLTSTGGALLDTDQMSSLRWLEAGATASYGAVVEPCNFPGKFPDPLVMMKHYLRGETLIEAYWKSVQMPGQGLFIGEPLARPYLPASQTNVGEQEERRPAT